MFNNPTYFPPSTSSIIKLPSSKKGLVIDTSNWPHMRNVMEKKEKDPLKLNFDWVFWCGIVDDKEYNKFVQEYNKTAGYSKYFFGSGTNPNAHIDKYVKDPLKNGIIKKCIEQITKDMPRTSDAKGKTISNKDVKTLERIFFTIYINEYMQNLWYIQGEQFFLYRILELAKTIKPKNPEPMAYLLYNTMFFKYNLKGFFFPCEHIKINGHEYKLYNKKKLTPNQFFNYLFIVMLLKIKPKLLDGLSKKTSQYRKDFFSSLCSQSMILYSANKCIFNDTPMSSFKKIIGTFLVSRDIAIFFSYILSYWKANLSNSKTFKSIEDDGVIDGSDGSMSASMFLNMTLKTPNIYGHEISIPDYNIIKKFLTKKGTMKRFVKLASSHFKYKKGDDDPTYKIPNKFVKKIIKGGKRTRKHFKRSHRLTMKKY